MKLNYKYFDINLEKRNSKIEKAIKTTIGEDDYKWIMVEELLQNLKKAGIKYDKDYDKYRNILTYTCWDGDNIYFIDVEINDVAGTDEEGMILGVTVS